MSGPVSGNSTSRTRSNPTSQSNGGERTQVVKKGDTLSGIAQQNGVKLDDVVRANPQIKNPDLIFPGQEVKIPARAGAQGSADGVGGGASTGATTRTQGSTPAQGPVASYQQSQGAPPPVTARPTGQAAPQVNVDPQAQAQLDAARRQANLSRVASRSEDRKGQGITWETRSSHTRDAEARMSTNEAASVGRGGTGSDPIIAGQTRGTTRTRSTETTLNGQDAGQTTTTSSRTSRGWTRESLTTAEQNVSGSNANRGTSVQSQSTTVSDRDGNSLSTSTSVKTDAQGRVLSAQEQSTTSVHDGVAQTNAQRDVTATNTRGQSVQSTEESVTYRSLENGETSSRSTKVTANSNGHAIDNTSVRHDSASESMLKKVSNHTEATANFVAVEHRTDWIGHTAEKSKPLGDNTGVEGEYHALAVQGNASYAAGVNLKEGKAALGGQAGVAADLVGVSGRAQVGQANSLAGAGYVMGEAHVGARASVGGGVEIDPRKGTAKVGVGGEAFAGAEVRVSGGYQNRYFGVDGELRGQVGAGVAGRFEAGIDKGVIRFKADFGAALGLGGRGAVNINVNAGAILEDGGKAIKKGAQWAGNKAGELKDAAVQKGREIKQAVSQRIDEGKRYVQEKAAQVQQKATELKNTVVNKASELKNAAGDAISSGWKKLSSWF